MTSEGGAGADEHDVSDVNAESASAGNEKAIIRSEKKPTHTHPKTPAMTKSHIWNDELVRTDNSKDSLGSSRT
jgi:hypothetical protein